MDGLTRDCMDGGRHGSRRSLVDRNERDSAGTWMDLVPLPCMCSGVGVFSALRLPLALRMAAMGVTPSSYCLCDVADIATTWAAVRHWHEHTLSHAPTAINPVRLQTTGLPIHTG